MCLIRHQSGAQTHRDRPLRAIEAIGLIQPPHRQHSPHSEGLDLRQHRIVTTRIRTQSLRELSSCPGPGQARAVAL